MARKSIVRKHKKTGRETLFFGSNLKPTKTETQPENLAGAGKSSIVFIQK